MVTPAAGGVYVGEGGFRTAAVVVVVVVGDNVTEDGADSVQEMF